MPDRDPTIENMLKAEQIKKHVKSGADKKTAEQIYFWRKSVLPCNDDRWNLY